MNPTQPPPLPKSPPPLPAKRPSIWQTWLNPIYWLGGLVALAILGLIISQPPTPIIQSEFIESSGHIEPGVQFYLRDSKSPVCVCKRIEIRHHFDDGTTRQGVLCMFPDGVEMWIPRDAVKKIYVVKNPNFK